MYSTYKQERAPHGCLGTRRVVDPAMILPSSKRPQPKAWQEFGLEPLQRERSGGCNKRRFSVPARQTMEYK